MKNVDACLDSSASSSPLFVQEDASAHALWRASIEWAFRIIHCVDDTKEVYVNRDGLVHSRVAYASSEGSPGSEKVLAVAIDLFFEHLSTRMRTLCDFESLKLLLPAGDPERLRIVSTVTWQQHLGLMSRAAFYSHDFAPNFEGD